MNIWRKALDQNKVKPSRGKIEIMEDRCKGCRFCIEFCPKHVLGESKTFNAKGYHPAQEAQPEECVNCGLCEMLCPEFAIKVTPEEEEKIEEVVRHG